MARINIKATDDLENVTIEKFSDSENYKISNTEGQVIWLTEQELRALKALIDDVLQTVHRRDY